MPETAGNLREAVRASGLKNGERISFHHHLRMGDQTVEQVLTVLEQEGYRDLILCASSLMESACRAVLRALQAGVVALVETTGLKEPLASAVMRGEVARPVIFRTHGGRARGIMNGETPVSVAFLAVSAVDSRGNANGTEGPNRFGSLGYALVDAARARHVILISDYLSPEPLERVSLPAEQADQVVLVPAIGDSSRIAGGSLRNAGRPMDDFISARAVEVLDALGVIRPGFNFQAGSGSLSLQASRAVASLMVRKGITGGFASGGVTGTLADLLEQGLFRELWDVQSFDDRAVQSLRRNPLHREMSASFYANPEDPDCLAHRLDLMLLSATEADLSFNVNSLTGSDGRILGALGGAPDTAAGAAVTAVLLPAFRGRIPGLRTRVRTICTPGDTVDLIITDRGFCVNPRREDLLEKLAGSGPVPDPPEVLMERIHRITGVPDYPPAEGRIVGIVEAREGGVLDRIRMD